MEMNIFSRIYLEVNKLFAIFANGKGYRYLAKSRVRVLIRLKYCVTR